MSIGYDGNKDLDLIAICLLLKTTPWQLAMASSERLRYSSTVAGGVVRQGSGVQPGSFKDKQTCLEYLIISTIEMILPGKELISHFLDYSSINWAVHYTFQRCQTGQRVTEGCLKAVQHGSIQSYWFPIF